MTEMLFTHLSLSQKLDLISQVDEAFKSLGPARKPLVAVNSCEGCRCWTCLGRKGDPTPKQYCPCGAQGYALTCPLASCRAYKPRPQEQTELFRAGVAL